MDDIILSKNEEKKLRKFSRLDQLATARDDAKTLFALKMQVVLITCFVFR